MNYTDGIIKNTEFFTTSELAEKLKMNVQVITRKVQAGEISAYKIGKEWRIPEQSVFNWLESNRNTRTRSADKVKVEIEPGRNKQSKQLPAARSKRKYLLEYILAQFEPDRAYTEEEVSRIIGRYHQDTAAVRQEFLSEHMMDRIDENYRRHAGYRLSG